ncbi:hypothetical protein RchiOBHm_Chr1g0358041 [Rosa chinensis]|uniref:Uncharacterized protein n=1 Tax=Rosa chinensis TaxID=74649 RepID=A0A2P6SI21_ROSCH|nr:hypothetical protein RchiOBHm_Chr1g0358041 [Rosa chinensis]
MRMEASGEALWRGSGSGMEVGSFYLDRGGDSRSVSSLRRSWVGAGTDFRRGAICRRGSICRLLQVSGPRLVSWRWLGSRFHGSDELLGVRSRTPARISCGCLCGVSLQLWRRGSTRWEDGGGCRYGRLPWWIAVRPWWMAALESCGKWWLGRSLLFGPGYLGLLLFLGAISPCIRGVGLVGPCACGCTHCALSALGWQRVPCFVKWSLPPSGRMKLGATGGIFRWQHDRKAVRMVFMLGCIRFADPVFFPLCHCWEANRTVRSVFFASWCDFEYNCLVESVDSCSGCTLGVYCNLGFRLFVPPCIRRFHL